MSDAQNKDLIQQFNLLHPIDNTKAKINFLRTKIELVLPKQDPSLNWQSLEPVTSSKEPALSTTKWDKLAKEQEDDDEPSEPNDFFKKIYDGADADTQRAMIKSLTESNGTCLSTNWESVKAGKVQPKPPSSSN